MRIAPTILDSTQSAESTIQPQPLRAGRQNQRLRVLFVHRDLPFHGGVPRCILYMARAGNHDRIDVRVGSFVEPSEPMVRAFDELGIRPDRLGDRGYLLPVLRLRKLIRREQTDVVVATSFKAYIVAKMATAGLSVGIIFWVHAIHGAIEGPLRRWLLAKMARHDPLLFVSQAVRRAQLPACHAGPSMVVHNGVEDLSERPEHAPYGVKRRPEFGIPSDALVLVMTAEFIAWKDHATAIQAVEHLVARHINAHLLLIGTGELFVQTKATVADGTVADRIHFLGARPDARQILGLADIYVHPARGEGFGLAPVEAMLAQKPVVCARDGAMVEYVTHGKTGLLFQPGDALGLADQVEILARDQQLRAELGKAARQHCLREFSLTNFAEQVCDFTERCAPPSRRRLNLNLWANVARLENAGDRPPSRRRKSGSQSPQSDEAPAMILGKSRRTS
jgi:glycosyltransferase involved in cell wall biosynthesis